MRVAIIGAGISGLTCAHGLHPQHDIEVFEAANWIGGHTHTVDVEIPGEGGESATSCAVDTGFIVYNERNYPKFSRLLGDLGVASQPTTMSFGFRSEITGIEYGAESWRGLVAQPSNLLRPRYLGMLRDTLRFFRKGRELLESGRAARVSLGEWLDAEGFGAAFCSDHLLPMGGAIWSVDPKRIREFPAEAFLSFFENHGLLSLSDRPQWRVIRGGSKSYVEALTRTFRERIHLESAVREIRRDVNGVDVVVGDGHVSRFDAVVLACHSDQALAMLAQPSAAERELLGAIHYQPNEVVLHTDASMLPRSEYARAAWNYRVTERDDGLAAVTYDMNRLQGLKSAVPLLVTLNQSDDIDPARVLDRYEYAHPIFDSAAVRAQTRHRELIGPNRTYYAGAYWGHGFHEDGVASAQRVLAAFEAQNPKAR